MKRFIIGAVAAFTLAACGGVSDECKAVLACAEAAGIGSSWSAYEEGGTCWTSGQASADACTAACEAAKDGYETAYGEEHDECKF